MDFSCSYEKVKNSVVNVLAVINKSAISSGTGTIIGDGSIVITCAHCIVDGTQIVIRFPDRNIFYNGELKSINKLLDIAIIKFPNKIGEPVTIKNSDTIRIGNEAFVLGFPNSIQQLTALSANIAGFENYPEAKLIRVDSSINHRKFWWSIV